MPGIGDLLLIKSAVVAVWGLILFVAERRRSAAPWPTGHGVGSWRRVLRNGGLWMFNAFLFRMTVMPLSMLAAYLGVWAAAEWWGEVRPAWWSGAAAGYWALVVDILVLDGWIYFWHRANHVVPLLWRFHEIHHLDPFLDTTTAVRFHFGELLLSACVRFPVIVVLGMPVLHVMVFETLVLLAALFQHSNLRLPPDGERRIARVFVTPSIHWMHHHARRADTDSNYATIFSFWDRLFGTACPHERTPDMAIGVEGLREPGFAGLLIRPFRIRRLGM